MKSYIAILRGINVSGKNLIKMEALKDVLAGLKLTDIKTYIQSGNIGFKANKQSEERISETISKAIKKQWQYDVPVIVFEKSYLESVIKNNPFIKRKGLDPAFLHVTFLNSYPDPELVKSLDVNAFKPDECIYGDKAFYLYIPGGYGHTKFNNTFFEKKLKVNATTRNWKTVTVLTELVND